MQKEKPRILRLLSDNVRNGRARIGLTQSQMAERVGISVRHLSDIERADAFPSPEVIEMIADVLGIQSYILFLPDDAAKTELLISSNVKTILDEEMTKAIGNTIQRINKWGFTVSSGDEL